MPLGDEFEEFEGAPGNQNSGRCWAASNLFTRESGNRRVDRAFTICGEESF